MRLNKRESIKLEACLAALRAIPQDADYASYRPLVIAACHKIGCAVWQWIDEGPGYRTLGSDVFSKLRTVRNSDASLFDAINAKR
jgi:hypothetical protein